MSASFSAIHPRVPPGFAALVEGLVKEILRDQPEDIPAYAAKYFQDVLSQGEGNCKVIRGKMRPVPLTTVKHYFIIIVNLCYLISTERGF